MFYKTIAIDTIKNDQELFTAADYKLFKQDIYFANSFLNEIKLNKGDKLINMGMKSESTLGLAAAQRGFFYKYFELSEIMISDINERIADYDVTCKGGNFDAYLGEFSSGPKSVSRSVIPDNSQDCVIAMCGVLSETTSAFNGFGAVGGASKPQEVLEEILRVLKPGKFLVAGSFSGLIRYSEGRRMQDLISRMKKYRFEIVNDYISCGFNYDGILYKVFPRA